MKPSPLQTKVRDVIGPTGLLAGRWPDYEHRPGQQVMADEVARAIENTDTAVVEAGTGTGKTMAYLLPALLSGLKTVVSTGTKNLQEQIFFKDVPFIRERLGAGFKAAYLKGRENYLCLHYYKAFLIAPTFAAANETVYFNALKEWAAATQTGDRAELTEFPEEFMTWSDISAPGDRCLGSKCPEFKECFLWKARRNAAAANLVVVNHHLFMADLSVRLGGHGEVIPEYQAVIFDEAHHLEDVATQHFGFVVSSWRLARLKRDAEKALGQKKIKLPALDRALKALGHQADVLAREFFPRDTEIELWAGRDGEMDKLREFGRKLIVHLGDMAARLEAAGEKDDEIAGAAKRARETARDLGFIINELPDTRFVYWAERRGRGLFLRASPIDVSSFLQDHLYSRGLPLVFTSATLTAGGSFDYFKERLGLLPEIDGVAVESPFDYRRQTLLYVPRHLPYPNSPEYLPALADEINRLLMHSQGRAFVLFTSYRNLNYVAEMLEPELPWTCLIQGHAPRNALLDNFRNDTHSVLLATQSFWQGVDVPGESLSAVIIDKLPFPRPDLPLVKARTRKLEQEGHDSFNDYSVPEAVITLKQGLGRLIRTRTDRGVLAVLDSRLVTKGYGKTFLKSLPQSRLTNDLDEVGRFFGN